MSPAPKGNKFAVGNKGGCPTLYNKDIADKLCDSIANSNKGTSTLCNELGLKPSTVYQWLQENKEFLEKYEYAKQCQADLLADEIIAIAEHREEDHTPFTGNNVVQRDRLRIDARKWIAAKLKPKKYGDKLEVEQTIREQPLF
jgi:hypothetical protein